MQQIPTFPVNKTLFHYNNPDEMFVFRHRSVLFQKRKPFDSVNI